jgi:nucleotide-binding universal stress UspA family protein
MTIQPTNPRIVVGIDGSDQSARALRWGAKVAADMGVGLDALAVWQYPLAYGWAAPGFNPRMIKRRLLAKTVEHALGAERAADVRLLVREGNAARILIEQSRYALMLIVGSHGHGGFSGMLIGSVCTTVAEHALCPVLVIRGDSDPLAEAPGVPQLHAASIVHLTPTG